MRTDALLLDRELHLSLGSREIAPPEPGEALVRVEFAGVCGSDLHVLSTGAWVAYWPATLGHEVVGVVQECPSAEIAVGTRVVVDSRVPCGTCRGCTESAHLCNQMAWLGEALPGGFARHLLVRVGGLVPYPEALEGAIAVLAEPLAVAAHAVSRLSCAPQDALILGYGPIGALVHAELARRWPGVPIFVSEPRDDRRTLALALGARPASQGRTDGSAPQTFSLVVDAAGYPHSLADACASASNHGTVLVVALSSEPVSIVPAELVERALTLVGSIGFDAELAQAVALLSADPDRYRPLVTETLLLEEAAERLGALTTSPSAGKVVIRPWLE
jgi:threonine dehydrogenase-like Zn-dependent dehydrogenase